MIVRTDKHTHRHTDAVTTILRLPIGGGVIKHKTKNANLYALRCKLQRSTTLFWCFNFFLLRRCCKFDGNLPRRNIMSRLRISRPLNPDVVQRCGPMLPHSVVCVSRMSAMVVVGEMQMSRKGRGADVPYRGEMSAD